MYSIERVVVWGVSELISTRMCEKTRVGLNGSMQKYIFMDCFAGLKCQQHGIHHTSQSRRPENLDNHKEACEG